MQTEPTMMIKTAKGWRLVAAQTIKDEDGEERLVPKHSADAVQSLNPSHRVGLDAAVNPAPKSNEDAWGMAIDMVNAENGLTAPAMAKT